MGENKHSDRDIASAERVSKGDAGLPASEEGTGSIPEDHGGDGSGTHLPASEADTSLIDDGDEGPPPQSWPGSGSPGTIPPPG